MTASTNNLLPKLRMNSSGFTLIELMVTIAVLAIIVSIATPNISSQLANQRVKSTTATLLNALKEAKAESVIRRQEIKLSYDNDGTNAGTIEIENDSEVFDTYQYDDRSTIKSTASQIEFKPSKTADAMVYTICDSNDSASPRQVVITAVANISSQLGGSCP
ncbi:pilus assembly FimT family protein [Psychrobacter sp. AOP7-D1-15]|uniref:pilus assembly FimT family protein n=1 Tax=unclassified Psychrobacter TaxID=196806 RepID=UPI00299F8BEF|nr:GspH/FimT family pseudopilin [Psychrobacter sp. FME61]